MNGRHLIAPREKPDGTISWEEEKPEIARRIREGDAEFGWLGDDRLSLHLNVAYAADHAGIPRWEIWRRHEDGTSSLVCSLVKQRVDGDGLIRQLAVHDSRTRDMAAMLLAERDRRLAAQQRATADENAALADRLAWGLGRDLDLPAQHGRMFPLGG